MTRSLDLDDLRAGYERRRPDYERAARNLREAIELLLAQAGIKSLAVTSRIKTFASFAAKAARKEYSRPFEENTDFVGLRVILYLPRDIAAVLTVLRDEFDVVEDEDTTGRLAEHEFGYRSHHLLLHIREEWMSTPSFRGLRRIAAEVQVRTLMMHAWADMAHNLEYKSTDQVPTALRRRLFLLSAKIEEVDQQFEDLVTEVEGYRRTVAEEAAQRGHFDPTLELNLDTFKELIAFFFPNREPHEVMTQELYQEVMRFGLTMPTLVEAAKSLKRLEPRLLAKVPRLNAPACFAYALDVFVDGFGATRQHSAERRDIIAELAALGRLGPDQETV